MAQISIIKEQVSTCPICKGEGYTFSISSNKKNISFIELCGCRVKACQCDGIAPYLYHDETQGKVLPCPCREARVKIDQIKELFNLSNIPVKYRYRRISEFQTDDENEEVCMNLAQAHDNAYFFIEQFSGKFNATRRGLYLFGNAGSGKTMLACLALNELILQFQEKVKFMKITRDFFNHLRSSYNQESEWYGRGDNLFKALAEVPALVIDDFGVQADSSWEQRTLYDLIDARYEAELPTIITSNVPPQEIESSFKNRIYSRLKEMTVFQNMIGLDYRERFQNS